MTYTLNASNASSSSKSKSRAATPRYGVIRFSQEVLLLIGLLALVFWLMAMFTYSPQDAAWSTSGAGQKPFVHNWMGRVGAWLADACYFGFGMSIWWLVLAAVQTWVTSLVRWMRGGVNKDGSPLALMPLWRRRFLFWGGLAILMIASCALEWTRLYRFENLLPGPAGGVFGYMMGFNALKWLGFAGSGLIGICLFVLGAAMVFGFSWGKLAEGLGARLDGMVQFGRERR
ncbi:DNA translocase FtsK 4TM domain-containing protein, partial [Comamonas thiooxydans]